MTAEGGSSGDRAVACPIEEFGHREPGADYRLRPGGYVVLRDAAGRVATIETNGRLFLPGGGQEAGEKPERAAVREALEETGIRVRLGPAIGVADEFVFGGEERAHFRKRCSFFGAAIEAPPDAAALAAAESEVLWLDASDAIARLAEGSQRWAVARARDFAR